MYARSDSADSAPRRHALALFSNLPNERRLRLSGSRYQIGYQHGVAHRAQIQRFLADRLARLNALVSAEKALTFPTLVFEYRRVIDATLPGMTEELQGLAAGAAITLEEAYLLQLRRELTGYQSVRARGDCTMLARLASGRTVLAQTIDLNGNMAPEMTLMEVEHSAGQRVLLVSFTGLLGYLGMNDRGLCVGLNLVLGGEWRPGIPAYMAIRHLLDEASTVDECLALLRALPLASSRSLTIADGRRLVTVEYILNELAVFEDSELVHANHFLHPEFKPRDELNPFARTSSLRRQEACVAALKRLPLDADVAAYFEFLDAPPVYVAPNDDIRRECTVGAVVMRPDLGSMYVKQRGFGARLAQ